MSMIDLSQYNPDDICPICHEKYGTTKGIYKTDCGHIFHNDCLYEFCEHEHGDISCPMCRADLGQTCHAVAAFKEKALGDDVHLFNGNKHILDIYRNQISAEGGRRRKIRKSVKKTKRTKRTKRRASKNRRTRTKRRERR